MTRGRHGGVAAVAAAGGGGRCVALLVRVRDRCPRLDGLPCRLPLQVDIGQEDCGVSRRRSSSAAGGAQLGHASARRKR